MSDTLQIDTMVEAFEASALPCRRGLTLSEPCRPEERALAEVEPLPQAMTELPPEQKSPAHWAYERILLYIQNFEKQLDAAQEVALGFAGSDAGILRIEGVGFFDPDILTFYGRSEDGSRTQLVQHVSQLNLMLRALPRVTPGDEPPRRFGFQMGQGDAMTAEAQNSEPGLG